jgi:hypothetical protein
VLVVRQSSGQGPKLITHFFTELYRSPDGKGPKNETWESYSVRSVRCRKPAKMGRMVMTAMGITTVGCPCRLET